MGSKGKSIEKYTNTEEESVPLLMASCDSYYSKYVGNEIIEKFDAKNILNGDGYWCSTGNHGVKDEIEFNITLEKSERLSAMWIHWAFAPGEFKIQFSNDNNNWLELDKGYRKSIKHGDVNWWKSILSKPKLRWSYKTFDERIEFDSAIWGKYVKLTMRFPVNQYFGIYRVEFYKKSRSIVMIKSMNTSSELCLTIVNGEFTDESPVKGNSL